MQPPALSWHFYIFFLVVVGNPQVFVEHKNPSFFFGGIFFLERSPLKKSLPFPVGTKIHDTPLKVQTLIASVKISGGINSSTPSCGFEKISDIKRIPWFSKGIDHTQISGVDRSPWQKRQSRWLSWEESCMMTVGSRVGQDIILYLFARWNFVLLPTGTATLQVGDWWKLSEITTCMRFPGRQIFRCPLDPPLNLIYRTIPCFKGHSPLPRPIIFGESICQIFWGGCITSTRTSGCIPCEDLGGKNPTGAPAT